MAYTSLPAIIASEQGQFCPANPEVEDLLLELALSVWLRSAELGLEEARATMLELRRTLVDLAGFDRTSEPIPLVTRDGRQALLGLARYLAALAERASSATGRPASELVVRALCRVQDRSRAVENLPWPEPAPRLATVLPLHR